MIINYSNIRKPEGYEQMFLPLKEKMEGMINLKPSAEMTEQVAIVLTKLFRLCLAVGLGRPDKRELSELKEIQLQTSCFVNTNFTIKDFASFCSVLMKLRYQGLGVKWGDNTEVSRIIAVETKRGLKYLLEEGVIEDYLLAQLKGREGALSGVPSLDLEIGTYEGDMPASLPINNKSITNSQILVAGVSGSGKTNLLAVLINQFRERSFESPYPVHFLLFDYKGEFSDPANASWLSLFDVSRSALLNPIDRPLPFSPFKDFTGKAVTEIGLYASQLSSALSSIDRTTTSAKMNSRLSESILNAYKKTGGAAVSFEGVLEEYQSLLGGTSEDSISSVLKQIVNAKIFAERDEVDIIGGSYIINMEKYPKDGPISKAIVYFIISKLNNIYETLPKQATQGDYIEIRHFTIIDEAHYMLSFDNQPLRNLIAVGRNKGLSIILATQNMASFKSKYFDFYANAQYPLIMKQQTIDDKTLKDIFGVSGNELLELRADVSGLSKGELIIKNAEQESLGVGKKWKKIKVTHLV